MFGFNWKTFERSGESISAARDGGDRPPGSARRPRIGLALGSGAARGWSHIGVLQELAARKVPIDVIAGIIDRRGGRRLLLPPASSTSWRHSRGR